MIANFTQGGSWRTLIVALAAAVTLAGCGAKNKNAVPTDAAQPDRFLFDRGTEALKKERWIDSREYFRQVVDNYPGSPLRADAKLGVADAYLGEGGTENLVLAAQEAGVKRFVYTASNSVVMGGQKISGGDETLPYF